MGQQGLAMLIECLQALKCVEHCGGDVMTSTAATMKNNLKCCCVFSSKPHTHTILAIVVLAIAAVLALCSPALPTS